MKTIFFFGNMCVLSQFMCVYMYVNAEHKFSSCRGRELLLVLVFGCLGNIEEMEMR